MDMTQLTGSATITSGTDMPGAFTLCPHCLSRTSTNVRPLPSAGGLSAAQQQTARDYILGRLPERFRLQDVARQCQLPAGHFARAFRISLGLPLGAWIQSQRIVLAMRLFSEGRRDISQIAVDCGFFDQSHFSRVFKKWMGVSPGAWLRNASRTISSSPPETQYKT